MVPALLGDVVMIVNNAVLLGAPGANPAVNVTVAVIRAPGALVSPGHETDVTPVPVAHPVATTPDGN